MAFRRGEELMSYRGLRRLRFEAYFATMPLHAWTITGRGTRKKYLELKASEHLSRSELDALQLTRLRAMVLHAYDSSDFYRHHFDSVGFSPSQIESLEDLSKIPFLSKDDVRENLNTGLISNRVDQSKILKITTSGSTGRPFTIFADRDQLEMRFAATLRALEWTGWRFGDRQARLWHQTLGMSKSQILREKIDAFLLKRLFIPAFEISPRNINDFVSKIARHKPVLVDGYAESLNFLATYIQMGGNPDFSPRAIMSSAQALPQNTRQIIEDGFKTKVFDKYGSREFSGIAYECQAHDGHHIVDECYIVELLVDGRPARPGEVGEVVITDLYNQATPMIRYRIGDLAVAVDNSVVCGCGRSHNRIGDIEGRTQAIVHCADGTWLPGTFFAHFFKDHEETIRFFQIEQHSKGAFELLIVRNESFEISRMKEIVNDLRSYVHNTEITIKYVDAIPLVRTGKRSPVVSHVSEDFQELVISKQIRKKD
jgi:phenylacetate-CoA ligase